jgi:hypothetical protein
MEIFLIAVRSLLMVVATLLVVVYVFGNMWKKLPSEPLKLKVLDYALYSVVGALFAFGLNSYWGFLAFLPMILGKVLWHTHIDKNKVRGKGRWMEVQWQKMTPRGFQMPQEARTQIARLPGDQHFIIPRFASLWAVNYFTGALRKNAAKMPQMGGAGQQEQAFALIEKMALNIKRLDTGKTEKIDLPFGVLKVTRL